MNQTKSTSKKLLALLLALIMTVSLLPMSVFAVELGTDEPATAEEEVIVPATGEEETEDAALTEEGEGDVTLPEEDVEPEEDTTLPGDEALLAAADGIALQAATVAMTATMPEGFIRIFHLDCGRKYFSVEQIRKLIKCAADNHYTHVELAFGNDGLRFLLDDMNVTVGETTYDGDAFIEGVVAGNKAQNSSNDGGYLSQSEMDNIIDYAKQQKVEIIPLLNSPGHMNAIMQGMTSLGISNVAVSAAYYGTSARTIDLTNTTATEFTKALVAKYAAYFVNRGCVFFNLGTDEYANDKLGQYSGSGGAGFGYLIANRQYNYFVSYVNGLADVVKKANMIPMAFNDGFYYNGNEADGTFDQDVVICYWSSGYTGYSPTSASNLVSKGHTIISTNDAWYYVLQDGNSTYTYTHATTGVNNTKCTAVVGDNGGAVTPKGCMLAFWCDKPTGTYDNAEYNKVAKLISTLAENNTDYFKADSTTEPETPEPGTTEPTTIKIELTVGEPKTERQEKVNVADLVGEYDATVASVSAEYKKVDGETTRTLGSKQTSFTTAGTKGVITDNAGNYMVIDGNGNISNTKDINEATEFTVARNNNNNKYTIQGNGYYLKLTSSAISTSKDSGSSFSYASSNGFRISSKNTYYCINYSNGKWGPANSNLTGVGHLYSFTSKTTDPVDATVITFTGKKEGTTTVTIGNVTYNITVTDKAPTGAMTESSINLEYWITNYKVYDSATANTSSDAGHIKAITKATSGAASEEGIAIAKIAPEPAYSFFDDTVTVHYWQAMRLDENNLQTAVSGDDETADGTTLTHIRYHSGAWQYKTVDGVWHYFQSTDQLVAYYLQDTQVTKEITSYVKDWGYKTDGTTQDTSSNKGQVALTVAVVYPDGTVSPSESNMYSNSSTIFNYWDGRDIGIVAPVNNSNYTISKITVTDGKRDKRSDGKDTSTYVWYADDTITWDKKENAAGAKWYDETEVWNKSSGTTPMVNGNASKITWSDKNTAKLVLIYLEAVEKETNLNVEYIDLNANNTVFHSYQIVMKYNEGDTVPTFTDKLMAANGTAIGGNSPWNSNVKDDPDYLPDDAYVANDVGSPQTFNKEITTIPNINGIYASGLYEYIRADISEDGKTLRLYYNLKPATGTTYVVDFGLPVVIPFTAFDITNANDVTVSFDQHGKQLKRTGNYGNGVIDMTAATVTYTLFKPLDARTPIPVYVTDANGKTVMRTVDVIPASTVYYEDSFASFYDAGSADAKTEFEPTGASDEMGKWYVDVTESKNVNQALEELGSKKNVYGYDAAYDSCTTFSMGSAKKVTVDANTYATHKANPTAQFTFKGTGFDVISLTDNTSGAIFVDVVHKNGDVEKKVVVDNYYGYTRNANGEWVVDNQSNNCLYQIPVIKVNGLPYDEYTVTIKVAYNEYFDHTTKEAYSFWLDAIRVYDPMGKDYDYTGDQEGYPQYIKLRDELAKDDGTVTTNSQLLFIDGKKNAEVALYKNYGPNNEVYLASGQAISFKLNIPDGVTVDSVQIGAKAPMDTEKGAVMKVNDEKVGPTDKDGNPPDIASATEMYYDITTQAKDGQQVTITNTGEGILSLTNLKITFTSNPGDTKVALGTLAETEQANAVQMVRALFAAPVEPDPEPVVFVPERFEASWSRSTVKVGQKATLTVKTSEDVDAITVDGVTIDTYRTRTERTGWGWNAKRVTYREFTYTITAKEAGTLNCSIAAFNAENTASEAITATLTVQAAAQRPSWGGWLGNLFGRWF